MIVNIQIGMLLITLGPRAVFHWKLQT